MNGKGTDGDDHPMMTVAAATSIMVRIMMKMMPSIVTAILVMLVKKYGLNIMLKMM